MQTTQPRWTDPRLLERLKALWSEAFGDTDQYISLVFERVYRQSQTRWRSMSADVAPPHNTDEATLPVAMLFATQYQFCDGSSSRRFTGTYLSGLATDIGYRRQGIMTAMLKDFIEDCKAGVTGNSSAGHPDFLFLIPADEHLRMYYEHFGFESSGERSLVNIELSGIPGNCGVSVVIPLEDISNGDRETIYTRISQYEKCGKDFGCLQILHSREAIDTAIAESAQNNGVVVTCGSPEGKEDAFLWADKMPNGWTCRVWNASSVSQMLTMAYVLRSVELNNNEGDTHVTLRLYGAPWQQEILREMYRKGICSQVETEPYAMILKLSRQVYNAPLSIELMLD